MEKPSYMRLKGSRWFRHRLLLSTLSQKAIIIEDIRSSETPPGLRSYEFSLIRVIERISDDCKVEINETGTKLKYKPGVLLGGKNLVHDCGIGRSISYFLELLVILGLRGKKPLSIRLKGSYLVDAGKVKRIIGVTFTTKVSAGFDHRMMSAARGVLNHFLPDVRIKDHRSQAYAGRLWKVTSC